MRTNRLLRILIAAVLSCGTHLVQAQFNYFAGTRAGLTNTGSYNTFVGFESGATANSGWHNTFYGYRAGRFNSTGFNNSFFGSQAGYSNTTGVNNTFLGRLAGRHNDIGNNNVFVGTSSGRDNSQGTNNTFLGNNTGLLNKKSGFNTFIGSGSGRNNNGGTNNAFTGASSGSNNTTGSGNTFNGLQAGWNNSTGNENSFYGFLARGSSGDLKNATAIGSRAMVTTSNSLVLGSINDVNGAINNTFVGIGTTSPAHHLHVNSEDAAKIGGGTWREASDERLKKDIIPFTEGLEVVANIKPVWFSFNGKAGIKSTKRFVGILAKDMQKAAPYTVGEFIYQDTLGQQEKYLDYDGNAVTYLLVNAVKELKADITLKNEKISQLEGDIAQFRAMLSKLTLDGNKSVASLSQNEPNPFNQSSTIHYYLPETAKVAQLKIFSIMGQEVYNQKLLQKGQGQVTINKGSLPTGTYLYYLVVDGKRGEGKKLVLTP